MKRTLLVLLALVMIVAAMCGLAMAAPTDDPSQAVVAVKIGDTTTYYDALNSDVIASVATTTGGGTITLLKDHALASKLIVPAQATANPIVLDLGGFTLTNSNNHNGIVLNGNVDFTIKNGIYVQSGAGQNIQISETGAGNKDSNGTYYTATVSFDDVCVMNTYATDDLVGGCVVESKYTTVTFNVTDSVLWSTHTHFRATFNMENNVTTTMVANNSIIGGKHADRVFRIAQLSGQSVYQLEITATDTTFVSGDGTVDSGSRHKVNGFQWGATNSTLSDYVNQTGYTTGSLTCTAVDAFTFTAPNGTALSGKASQFGNAPTFGTPGAPTPATYAVSYNANGGEGAPAAQTKTENVALTLSATVPTRAGFTFKGWATAADGEVAYAAGASYTENAALTLYAVWEAEAPIVAPDQVEESAAAVKAVAGGTTYYFENLNNEVIAWAAKVSGGATLTLLKNYTLPGKITFPTLKTSNAVVLDLGGFTMTSAGNYNSILLQGDANFTIKNGVYVQTGVGAAIAVGEAGAQKDDGAGYFYKATLNFEDVFVYNTNAGNAPIVLSKYAYLNMTVTDSVLWAVNTTSTAAVMRLENCHTINLTTNGSVLGAPNTDRVISGTGLDGAFAAPKVLNVKPTNTVFASSTGATIAYMRHNYGDSFGNYAAGGKAELSSVVTNNGATAVNNYFVNAHDGTALTAPKAAQFGTAPTFVANPSYPVSYNANGGEGAPAAQIKEYDVALTLSATVPTRFGYEFLGWATSVDGAVAYAAGASYTTNAPLVLYAQWKEIPLVTPDQVDASVAGIKVVAGGTTYYFAILNSEIAAWAGRVSGGAVITLLKDLTLSSTVSFPAEWNAAVAPIVIDLAGYTVSNGAASAMFVMKGNGNLTVKNGTILNEKAAASICVGASDGAFADAASNFYAPVLTLDKVFMKSTGTGNYICPIYGKSVASTININNSAIYSANTGWRGAIEVQTDGQNAMGNALNVTSSIIYTKSQRALRYENSRLVTLTFTDSAMVTQAAGGLTGGQIVGGRGFTTVAKLNGVDIKADASQTTSSTITGYTLANGDWEGTMPDGTAITGAVGSVFGTAPTSIVLPFSVNFDANGGTGSVAAQFSADGAAIVVADGTGLSKVGYHFAGWNTKADGSGDAYAAGDNIAVGGVLFAQWAPNTYTIVFDANGGQNETPDQVITYDVETAIASNRFSKLGFLFNGWNTEVDGSGTAYTVGQMVKNLLTEGSMTLYAQWKEIPPFVPGADGPTHTCTRACATCGGCLDANCTDPVCAKKCTSAILPYTDITAGAWYEDAVKYVTHAGLMNGTAADKFAPNAATSRAMVVTVLYRMEGAPAVYSANQFTDVADGLWYSDAIAWAAANGIVNGKSATIFDPNADITREQLAAILYRYANYKGVDVSVGEETNILSYVDAFDISEYAIPAFQWACGEGIINGKGNGVLDPIGNAKRCEFAKMLMAYIEG